MKYSEEIGKHNLVVQEIEQKYKTDLRKRLLNFAVKSIQFLGTLPQQREYDVFRYQLSRSATSIGANYEEAQASTYREFIQKSRIALREARESHYFLRIIEELKIGTPQERKFLIEESKEITLILGAIVSKCDQNNRES
jgi:four helix bundle protein